MRSRLIFIVIFSIFKLSCLTITADDVCVDFKQQESYKISQSTMQTATFSLDLLFEDEAGEYKLELLENSGSFSSMLDSLSFFCEGNTGSSSFIVSKNDKKISKEMKIFFPPQKIVMAGTYVKKIPIRVTKDGETVLQKEATLFFPVEEILDAKVFTASIEPNENEIFVDFKQIKGTAKEDVYLDIFTNKNIKVSISSKNAGRMILEGEEEKTFSSNFIPYVVESNGEMIALNTKTLLFTKLFTPNKGKITSKLSFILYPDLKKSFSGKYSDRVCITISSL